MRGTFRARGIAATAMVFLAMSHAAAQPVHHWPLDDASGLRTSDRSCGQGQLLGFELDDDTQWVDGEINGGLDLGVDGTFDNRVLVDSQAIGAGNGFTVAMWIHPGENINNLGEYQLLATPGDAVGFTIMNFDNGVDIHDRVLLFWDGNLPNLHVGTTTLEPGEWYHVAITSTGIGGEKLYYVNGILEDQALFLPDQGGTDGVHPGNVDGWPAGQAQIGAIGAGARGHDSILDDVRIYDRALSEAEIADVMAEDVPVAPTIENIFPGDGVSDHNAEDGLSFDVVANQPGATIAVDGVSLFLNDVDVSADLDVVGSDTQREVIYEGLEVNQAYVVRIEVVDSNGALGCTSFSFGTIQDGVPGLVHYFQFDEASGNIALDFGSANNGTLIGFENNDDAQWVQGVCDNGLDTGADDTINNYVEFPANRVNAFDTGGFTVAMWINPGEQILTAGEYQLLSTPGDQIGFTIMNFAGEETHDRVLLFWDGSLPNLHVGTTTLEPGTWYHVAITSPGAGNGDKQYYVNGELEEQTLFLPSQGGIEGSHPATRDGWEAGVARIGAINAGDRAHDTIYDDVRIYNRPLEEDEIFEVLNECEPEICNPLVLADLAPAGGETFYNAADGIVFEVSTTTPDRTIEANDLQMIVNGEDVSGDLDVGGTDRNRVVSYNGLVENTAYEVSLSITDGCATLQRRIVFGTYSPCDDEGGDGLVHLFQFNEAGGLAALDCVGGTLGTLNGFENNDNSQWIDGVVNGGIDMGADETLDNNVEFDVEPIDALGGEGFTIATWIRPGDQIMTPGEYQIYNAPGGGMGFTIMNSEGEVRHDRVLLFWDGSLPDLHVGVTTLEPDTWYHVAITSGGFGGDKLYYINGVPEDQTLFIPSQGGTEGLHPVTNAGWGRGRAQIGGINLRYHDTAYDDFRIYNRPLEEDEIEELAGSEPPPPPGSLFIRGDGDASGAINITDGIFILNFLFLGGPDPLCADSADADDSGSINITDGIFVLNFLFLGGPNPPAPYPDCGLDSEEDDGLTCPESVASCL
ncbi:MAG: LamG domain-containing protein [Planctomycetota bacterium]